MAWGSTPSVPEEPTSLQFLPIGSTVQFKTALGGQVVGVVTCVDTSLNVLAVKDVNGVKPVLRVFNLALINEIKEIAPANPDSIEDCLMVNQQTSAQQAAERRNAALTKRKAEAMHEDVSLDGQRAFVQLRRTLDAVHWKGADIYVLDRVIIRKPYTVNAAEKLQDNQQCESALSHVKKILSKPFVGDVSLVPCCRTDEEGH